jgi:hypothetical protein
MGRAAAGAEGGVNDGADHEARDNLMYAATLAGIAFGNSANDLICRRINRFKRFTASTLAPFAVYKKQLVLNF